MAAMVMHEEFASIELVDGKAQNKKLSDSMIVAVTFIAVHVAVVIVGLISEIPGAEPAALGALSRSKFVRFCCDDDCVVLSCSGFESNNRCCPCRGCCFFK